MDFLPDVIGGDEEPEENIVVEVVKPTLNEDDVFEYKTKHVQEAILKLSEGGIVEFLE